MPTGRFVLRAYSPRHDAPCQRQWTENQKGEFVTMANAIADALEEAVPVILKQVEDAAQRRREQEAREKIERRRRQARERAEAWQRARQAAKEELRSIVKAWNDAFALEHLLA
jgi:vacuolar-type H+-ATPase subunit E/Vma4